MVHVRIACFVFIVLNLLNVGLGFAGADAVLPDHAAEEEWIRQLQAPRHRAPNPQPDLRGDWAAMIDAAWGPGLDPADHSFIFQSWLLKLEDSYALFYNRDVDLNGMYQPYLPEINAGVSKGRFHGMLSSLSMAVQNGHTALGDFEVFTTMPEPGVPLLMGLDYLDNPYFGACLTTDENGEAFVYEVIDNHPLGLELGDVILGYDGRPWSELLEELIAAELPIAGGWLTSQESFDFGWAISVGNNWHLFDTIDIRKFGGEVQSLSTSLMVDTGLDLNTYCNDQINDAMPHPVSPDWLTYEVLEIGDKRVGFIWCDAWIDNIESAWTSVCMDVVNDLTLDGLIIDFRNNIGGNMHWSSEGLRYLFSSTVNTVNFGQRSHPNDHFAMYRPYIFSYYTILGNPSNSFDKPIAVLMGPRTISSGDQVAYRMHLHPQARTFGRRTSCSYDSPQGFSISGHPDFTGRYSHSDAGPWNQQNTYLSYVGFPVDEEVWLTPEGARDGRDDVINAALAWICPELSSAPQVDPAQAGGITALAPNPANPRCVISFRMPEAGSCRLEIYDLAGRRVSLQQWTHLEAGPQKFSWDGTAHDGRSLSSGTYLVRLKGDSFQDEGRLTLVR